LVSGSSSGFACRIIIRAEAALKSDKVVATLRMPSALVDLTAEFSHDKLLIVSSMSRNLRRLRVHSYK
jgi:hypothetical protein